MLAYLASCHTLNARRSFMELEDGKVYVAAGQEKFRKLPYEAIIDEKTTLLKNREVHY